jgi:mRNA interferase RelE/StbE
VTPWLVEWTRPALRDLRRLTASDARRVVEAVDVLAEEGRGDVKKLRGQANRWRLRAGDVRAIFAFDDERHTISVVAVAPRGSAYRD